MCDFKQDTISEAQSAERQMVGGVTGIYVVHSSMALLLIRDFSPERQRIGQQKTFGTRCKDFAANHHHKDNQKSPMQKLPCSQPCSKKSQKQLLDSTVNGRKHAQSGKTLVDGTAET